jgi:hypothetical protein
VAAFRGHEADEGQLVSGGRVRRRVRAGRDQGVDGGGIGHRHAERDEGSLQQRIQGGSDLDRGRIGEILVGIAFRIIRIDPVQVTSKPPRGKDLIVVGGAEPDIGRSEMALVVIGIADRLHDAELPFLVKVLQAAERRMQPRGRVQLERLGLGNQYVGPRLGQVGILIEGQHGVEAVIAAVQAQHHQHAIALGRQRRERGHVAHRGQAKAVSLGTHAGSQGRREGARSEFQESSSIHTSPPGSA